MYVHVLCAHTVRVHKAQVCSAHPVHNAPMINHTTEKGKRRGKCTACAVNRTA